MTEFSSDAEFDDLTDRDHSVEMVGYVDEISATAEVGKGLNKYKLFKFVLNNNSSRRIQCLIWGDELISKYQSQITIQEIVHIDGGHAKAVQSGYYRESQNLVPFELIIQKNTMVDFLGPHVPVPIREMVPIEISFADLMEANGFIKVRGFVKTKFAVSPSRFGNMSYGCGSITDGTHKITVNISNYSPPLLFEKGSPVIVTGELKIEGEIVTISCSNSSNVEDDNDIDPMAVAATIRGNRLFKRRREVE